jgi:DNA polymerase III sliding clamp (beta) subunit (PCNA family)
VSGVVDYGMLQFSVQRFALSKLAEWASVGIPSSAAQPVLGCFRVTVAPSGLCLAATDTQLSVFAETPAVRTQDEGSVYLPAKTLRSILAEATEGEVTVAVKRDFATVTAGAASWSLRLPPSDRAAELPALEGAQFSPVNRENFLAALKTVRHAVGRDSGRPQYTQVSISAGEDGAMYASAADSSQYTRAPLPGFPFKACIPLAALDDLSKLMAGSPVTDVTVADTGPALVFRVGPVTLAVMKLASEFPERLAGQGLSTARSNKLVVSVDKAELVAAIRRVQITSDAKTSALGLILDQVDGKSTLTVQSRDQNENGASETVPAAWTGGHLLVVVNWRFLLDMLAVHPSPACEFRFSAAEGKRYPPLLLEDGEAGVSSTIPQMPAKTLGY